MNLKLLILLLLPFSLIASFQSVKIGKIDRHYSTQIGHKKLKEIIFEIQKNFEKSLGMRVFDYSNSGIEIDILYIPPSSLEKIIDSNKRRLNQKKKRLKELKRKLPKNSSGLEASKKDLAYKNSLVNAQVKEFNSYVRDVNRAKTMSKEEYQRVKEYIAMKKRELDGKIKKIKRERQSLNREINSFNRNIYRYNNLVRDINGISNRLESMGRRFKKVKGKTFMTQETTLHTLYEDGRRVKKKSVKTTMEKIEIYGFDSLAELKAVLAHELAHLVGVPHIEIEGALMNPILQKNQLQKLELTKDDIKNFKENF